MTLDGLRWLRGCALVNETILGGGTMKPLSHCGDLENGTSIGTAAAFTAKILLDEHTPYIIEYIDGIPAIIMNIHFIREVRRQLSGTILEVTTEFSPYEESFYTEYSLFVMGTMFTGEKLLALEALDLWLVDEIQSISHQCISRSYSTTHKWMRLEERDE